MTADGGAAPRSAAPGGTEAAARIRVELWRLALPVLWLGMLAAISFIEAPLKFQAPGITIPLGLGIGRLVFAALNAVEAVILAVYTVLCFWPRDTRVARGRFGIWLALLVVLAGKLAVVRPPLNARTDLVLQGADAGSSPWHAVYIACDAVTMLLLVACAAGAGRAVLRASAPPPR